MIGIYKQLRYRIAAYYEDYGLDMAFMRKMEPEMERIYALSEYYHLKRTVPPSQFYTLLQEIARMDNRLMAEREQRLKDDLGIDSLRLVEVLVALEEEFGVTLKEADLDPEAIQTVGDVYALMEKYRLSPA